MSIKSKIFVAIILLSTLATIGIYFFSYDIILKNIEMQEKKTLYQNVERIEKVLDKELGSLNSTCLDWAAWDDTYYFVQNKNEHYKSHLLNYENLSNLNVDTILFSDQNYNVFYSKTLDQKNHAYIDDSQDLKNVNAQISNLLKAKNGQRKITGLMFINNKLTFISVHSTMKTDRTGYPNGFLIMGRYVSLNELKELEDITNSQVVIEKNNDLFQDSFVNKLNFSTNVIDNNTIEGKTVVIDINGENSILLTLKSDRFMYNEGYTKFKLFILHFIMLMLLIVIMSLIVVQKLFISRLEKLSRFMEKINGNVDMTLRSEIYGNDEISNLAKITNSMLERIASANMQLGENEKRLSQVIDGSSDGFWDINLLSKVVYLSPRLLEIAGYDLNQPVDPITALSNILPKQEFNNIIDVINNPSRHNIDSFKKEYRITTISGETKWLLTKGKVVERDSYGTPLRLAGISADITENKNYEHAIEYLSFHDFLTGLYNRPYLFKELERLNIEDKFPLSIIMGDANGLKLINDAFGHKEGDNLLIEIANILKLSCGDDAIIARLGGDEFIILLPESTELQAAVICDKIKSNCSNSTLKPVKPSISLGVITEYEPVDDIQKLFEIAEDRMYNHKLLESKSTRHSIIAIMERSLLETDFETREHTERLYNLSHNMGNYLRLPNNMLDELGLLSKLHDIGKIAIPREILVKPDTLTQSELDIIRKHTEIGYRMAISSPDLAPIAEAILSHHENWDGSGYPRGLKGEEIPLLSRIISIIDAYDVITHARPYKKARSHEEAIDEISRCSGTQFDPQLVDIFKNMFIE